MEFSDLSVKIGQSISHERRTREIETISGKTLTRKYVSDVHNNYHQNENLAHKQFSGQHISGEWFRDCFDKAVSFIETLQKNQPSESDLQKGINSREKLYNNIDELFPNDLGGKIITKERFQFYLAAKEALDDACDGACSYEKALISLVATAFISYSKSTEGSTPVQQIAGTRQQ